MAMTKPEETTAALIARLHNELEAARKGIERLIGERDYHKKVQAEAQDGHEHALNMHRAAARESDEQRARAEKAEEIAEVHAARCEGFERELAKANKRVETLAADFATVDRMLVERTRERDEAREMLAIAEKHRADAVAEREHFICEARREYRRAEEAREQLAKLEWNGRLTDAGHFIAAACPLCDGVDPAASAVGRLRKTQIGHRPTCWFAKKEAAAAPAPAVPETFLYIYSGGPPPKPPEPARPEPRFKLGQKVSYRGELGVISDILSGGGYFVGFATGSLLWLCDDDLKPAPKFAVGEWVTHGDKAGEIIERYAAEGSWIYKLSDAPAIGHWEQTITAQTPQHKHDCKGCVFLGRMGEHDLYFCPETAGEYAGVVARRGDVGTAKCEQCRPVNAKTPELIEARRRAVARGLV